MSKNIDSLYICPWSMGDPLCQSQCLSYVIGLADSGYRFAFVTFEMAQYEISPTERRKIAEELAVKGIYWHPVSWPPGNLLSDKLRGIFSVLATGAHVCFRCRPRIIHSRSSLPSFASVALSRIFRTKFLYDADSLLSEEYVDVGYISRNSRAYKILAKSEKWARSKADRIIVLTQVLRDIYRNEFGVKVPIDVIPCCVDTERFKADLAERTRLRRMLGLKNEILFTYVGKVGSWYLVDETFDFFKNFNDLHPESRMLIVSRDPPETFRRIAEERNVSDDLFFVRSSEHSEVPSWLSASDLGLSLIWQVGSKRGTSPVKFAEYLSVGLPVIITSRIGDCDAVINDNDVGVVLDETNDDNYNKAGEKIMTLLGDREATSTRCREAAVMQFSVENVGVRRYVDIYKDLLSGPKH